LPDEGPSRDDRIVKFIRVVAVILPAAGAVLAAVWLRERRAHSVFPASQAASLLHPARRLIYSPRATVAAFDIRPAHRTLEVGPGPGYFTAEAARAGGGMGRVVCVDLQPAMIHELRRHLPDDIAPRVRTLAADAMHLPLADASFDRAFLVAVLGEVPEPGRAVAELYRVLRPGGTVSFCETVTDPDYVREGTLRRLGWDAGLRFVDRRKQALGYIMRFSR
jgi:ubiquinone/menaquinone biosynthesis C-methylase UbiE